VQFHVWIPEGNRLAWIQPYVQQGATGGWTWTGAWQPVSNLKTNAWNTVTLAVPSNAATPLFQLGVQFSAGTTWSGTAYVDSIAW
jgi:hypothetical protein